MDSSISKEKQDLICSCARQALYIPHELLQERSKECWSTKSNCLQVLSIGCHNVLDSDDFWFLWISIQSEAVVHGIDTHVSGDSSESKCRETLIRVIWLNHHAYIEESALILIVGSEVMERARLAWCTIGCSKVNCCHERNSPTRS
jgi:hypothetical protein